MGWETFSLAGIEKEGKGSDRFLTGKVACRISTEAERPSASKDRQLRPKRKSPGRNNLLQDAGQSQKKVSPFSSTTTRKRDMKSSAKRNRVPAENQKSCRPLKKKHVSKGGSVECLTKRLKAKPLRRRVWDNRDREVSGREHV